MSKKNFQNEAPVHLHGGAKDQLLNRVASEIMELFATFSPTYYDVVLLLDKHMKQEGDFALLDQRFSTGKKRKSENQINITRSSKTLQLQILDKIGVPIYTKEPIIGENCSPLKVALVDSHSGEVVTNGPEASARVRIVVLKADVDGPEELQSKIVTKEGKRKLFSGDLILYLKEGTCYIGSVHFHQTRTWKKKHEYRLGVMVEDDSIETKIREGISESFYVKDRRLLLDKKNNPPKLSFEVWRLKGIAKNGPFHKHLRDFNINTVGDFLKELKTDPQKLRDILGKRMTSKSWEGLVGHAHTCILDEKTNTLTDKIAKLEVIMKMHHSQLCREPILELMNRRVVQANNMDEEAFINLGEVFTSNIDGLDHQQAKASSRDIVSSIDTTGDMFSLNDLFHDAMGDTFSLDYLFHDATGDTFTTGYSQF